MDRFKTKVPIKKAHQVIAHALVLAISIGVTIVLVENQYAHRGLEFITGFGLVFAVFISGMLFTSIFTTPVAIASFLILGAENNPLIVATIGAFGSVVGDAFLLKIIKQDILSDLEVFTKPFTTPKLKHIFQSKLMFFPITMLAAIILASPLPDELAIVMFGVVKLKTHYFYLLSFVFNFLGILAITAFGSVI